MPGGFFIRGVYRKTGTRRQVLVQEIFTRHGTRADKDDPPGAIHNTKYGLALVTFRPEFRRGEL